MLSKVFRKQMIKRSATNYFSFIVKVTSYEGRLISLRNCFITETKNRKRKKQTNIKIHHKILLLKTDLELKYYIDILKNTVYMKH